MADPFPYFIPNTRTYTPGKIPSKNFKSLAGASVRTIHGTTPVGHKISLGFNYKEELESREIIDHYLSVGEHYSFVLPDSAFSGLLYPATLNPTNQLWLYTGPPKVTYLDNGYNNISVDFISVPS